MSRLSEAGVKGLAPGRGVAVNPLMVELLGVLDGADHMYLFAWTQAVAPPPLNAHGHVDFRTRATREWFLRWTDLVRASIGLMEAGLAEVVAQPPGESELIAITDAGRRYLGQTRAP